MTQCFCKEQEQCLAFRRCLAFVKELHLNSPQVRSGEVNGIPLQYCCLENTMDGGACWAAVHGVDKSRTWLSDFTFTFHFHALEKELATHSSVLAWRIPGMGEPGGLLSMGLHRVGHDWSNLAAAAAGEEEEEVYQISLDPQFSLCSRSRGQRGRWRRNATWLMPPKSRRWWSATFLSATSQLRWWTSGCPLRSGLSSTLLNQTLSRYQGWGKPRWVDGSIRAQIWGCGVKVKGSLEGWMAPSRPRSGRRRGSFCVLS